MSAFWWWCSRCCWTEFMFLQIQDYVWSLDILANGRNVCGQKEAIPWTVSEDLKIPKQRNVLPQTKPLTTRKSVARVTVNELSCARWLYDFILHVPRGYPLARVNMSDVTTWRIFFWRHNMVELLRFQPNFVIGAPPKLLQFTPLELCKRYWAVGAK